MVYNLKRNGNNRVYVLVVSDQKAGPESLSVYREAGNGREDQSKGFWQPCLFWQALSSLSVVETTSNKDAGTALVRL